MAKRITPQQMRFVEEYLKNGNRVEAAITAGYSAKSAESRASKLLAMPQVQEYRAKLADIQLKQLGIDESWMAKRLYDIVLECSKPGESWHPTGAVKAIHEMRDILGLGREEEQQQKSESFEDWLATHGEGSL